MVTVFGLGFVGLTTALGFAHMGRTVYGIDVDEERKARLKKGELPFLEPEMDGILRECLDKTFFVTDDVEKAIAESEYVFYCVGTPYGQDGSADLTYLFKAIDTTVDAVKDNKFRVIVTKSTIPPATTSEKIVPYVRNKGERARFMGIANNPEFLREGHCWSDFMEADRIVLGVEDEKSEKMLRELYSTMDVPVFAVSHNTGEFIKYLSNTLLATMISYSNEMAEVADTIGDIEVAKAFRILHMDKRWGDCNMKSYVYPGCGYGGYCLPKDTNALFAQAREKGYEAQILKNVIGVNDKRPEAVADKITRGLQKNADIGIFGLSFKPDSDDVRDTPAAKVIRKLIENGYHKIYAYDPVAIEEFHRHYPELEIAYVKTVDEVMEKCDVCAILTAWDEFKALSGERIIDCRYCLED